MVLISAHQCGAPKGAPDAMIPEALEAVLTTACDYVEVDVRRTVDGRFVVRHDARVTTADGHPRVATLTLDELQRAEPTLTTYDQVLAQLDLWRNRATYARQVYMLPKHLDEEVARLHLEHLGVHLTRLSTQQASYIGVPVEGPYKPEHYRY